MATTPRSEPETTQPEGQPEECRFCRGKLSIIVSRDPDEEVDCVCTDPPLSAAERLDIVERRLGVVLLPWQRQWAMRALDGDQVVTLRARRGGWATVLRAVEEAERV